MYDAGYYSYSKLDPCKVSYGMDEDEEGFKVSVVSYTA